MAEIASNLLDITISYEAKNLPAHFMKNSLSNHKRIPNGIENKLNRGFAPPV